MAFQVFTLAEGHSDVRQQLFPVQVLRQRLVVGVLVETADLETRIATLEARK